MWRSWLMVWVYDDVQKMPERFLTLPVDDRDHNRPGVRAISIHKTNWHVRG
jgi:hypothetical protein